MIIENLEKLLQKGLDDKILRFSLGNAYLQRNDIAKAEHHFRAALEHDPHYSAAWKLLGVTLTQAERPSEAIEAYTQGIKVAEENGDLQVLKEMQVFLRRLKNPG